MRIDDWTLGIYYRFLNLVQPCFTTGLEVARFSIFLQGVCHDTSGIRRISHISLLVPSIRFKRLSVTVLEFTGSWALVFQVPAGVTVFGMIFYLPSASSEKQFD